MQTQPEPKNLAKNLGRDPATAPFSCVSCGHINVCTLFRAVAPLLGSWEKNKPLQPEDLAKICREYVPQASIKLLKEGQ